MFKKLISVCALVLPMFLVACGSSSSTGTAATGSDETTTTTMASYAGTYTGTTTGVNGGPTTIIIASDNTIKGMFTINNRTNDNGVPTVYEATFDGKVSSSGAITVNAYLEGALVMIFSGQISSSGALTGTYYEAAHPNDPAKSGSFTLQGPANGSTTVTVSGGSASGCTGSFVGNYDAPSHEERIRLRNLSLQGRGIAVTGDDATDNANAGGGGVDGGIYMTGSYSFETDANCNVVKGTTMVFYTYQYDISGKVNSNGTFALTWSGQGSVGELAGSVDASGAITGQFYHPPADNFVYGTMSGKFTPNGKI
ncbi:MAG: hypothetical protein ABIO88_13955 [Burkholderiaceae bacterium]